MRPGEMHNPMAAAGIRAVCTTGVGLRRRGLPRTMVAFGGLVTHRLTHPEAAQMINVTTSRHRSIAHQGYGVRR